MSTTPLHLVSQDDLELLNLTKIPNPENNSHKQYFKLGFKKYSRLEKVLRARQAAGIKLELDEKMAEILSNTVAVPFEIKASHVKEARDLAGVGESPDSPSKKKGSAGRDTKTLPMVGMLSETEYAAHVAALEALRDEAKAVGELHAALHNKIAGALNALKNRGAASA